MITIFAGILIILFIENRIRIRKPMHIHYLCIVFFSLMAFEVFNTLINIALLYWFIRNIKSLRLLPIRPYIIPLFIFSLIILITGLFSAVVSGGPTIAIAGSYIRNFGIMFLWPVLISDTIKDLGALKKLAYFYSATRIIEVGITGMFIYFFIYEPFYIFVTLSEIDISIADYSDPRLLSLGAPNSNDAAFVLLGAFGIMVYKFFGTYKFRDVFFILVAVVAMFLTWTRSVWAFVFLYLFLFFILNKKVSKYALLAGTVIMIIVSIVTIKLYEQRKSSDERLQTTENAFARQQQYIDYISAIPRMPFLWGMHEDSQIVASKLQIKEDFSAENFTLETFTRNGIFAGLAFLLFFIYIIVDFSVSTRSHLIQIEGSDKSFIIAIYLTFIVTFLMAQTSLFRNNLIFYVFIGFLSVIKDQYKHHEIKA